MTYIDNPKESDKLEVSLTKLLDRSSICKNQVYFYILPENRKWKFKTGIIYTGINKHEISRMKSNKTYAEKCYTGNYNIERN